MQITVADNHGNVVAVYSTVASEAIIEPEFASGRSVVVAALAEAIMSLSTPIELETTALAGEVSMRSDPGL